MSADGETQALIDEAAAHWLLRLRDADLQSQAEVQAEFTRWLEADSRHGDAIARMKAVWDTVGGLAAMPALAPLRRDAVEELERLRRSATFRSARQVGLRYGFGVASAGAMALAAYLMFWPAAQSFETAIGERRTIALSDQSRIELDANSAVSVEFSRRTRLVHVLRGEAYFRVAKDAARPFVVERDDRSVTATGTAFDVEALPNGLHVTLVEGHVLVRASASVLAHLAPGDSLTSESGAPPRLVHGANILALLAWRTGHVVFDDVPLSDAVGRMQRYTRTQVTVDPAIAALRISGVFKAGDLIGLIGAVETYYHITAENADGTVRLTRRP